MSFIDRLVHIAVRELDEPLFFNNDWDDDEKINAMFAGHIGEQEGAKGSREAYVAEGLMFLDCIEDGADHIISTLKEEAECAGNKLDKKVKLALIKEVKVFVRRAKLVNKDDFAAAIGKEYDDTYGYADQEE